MRLDNQNGGGAEHVAIRVKAPVAAVKVNGEERLRHLKTLIREGELAQIQAFLKGNRDVVMLQGEVDGATALHVAVEEENDRACLALLRKKAPTKLRKPDGNTPLHTACMKGSIAIVKLLVQYDPEAATLRNNNGLKPAELARQHKHIGLSSALERMAVERRRSITQATASERDLYSTAPSEASSIPTNSPQVRPNLDPHPPPGLRALPAQHPQPPESHIPELEALREQNTKLQTTLDQLKRSSEEVRASLQSELTQASVEKGKAEVKVLKMEAEIGGWEELKAGYAGQLQELQRELKAEKLKSEALGERAAAGEELEGSFSEQLQRLQAENKELKGAKEALEVKAKAGEELVLALDLKKAEVAEREKELLHRETVAEQLRSDQALLQEGKHGEIEAMYTAERAKVLKLEAQLSAANTAAAANSQAAAENKAAYTAQIQSLVDTITELTGSGRTLELRNTELSSQLSSSMDTAKSLSSRLSQADEALAQANSEVQDLKRQLAESSTQAEPVKQVVLNESISSLSQPVVAQAATSTDKSDLAKALGQLQEEHSRLQEQERKARENENHMRTNLQERLADQSQAHSVELSELTRKLQRETEAREELEGTNKRLEDEVQAARTRERKTSTKDKLEMNDDKIEIRKLTHANDKAAETIRDLRREIEGMKRYQVTIENEREAFLQATESLQAEVATQDKENAGLQDKVKRSEGDKLGHEQEIEELQARLANHELVFKIEHEQTEIERGLKLNLQKQHTELTEKLAKAEETIRGMKIGMAKQQSYQEEALIWKAKFSEAGERADKSELRASILKGQCEDLQVELDRLKASVAFTRKGSQDVQRMSSGSTPRASADTSIAALLPQSRAAEPPLAQLTSGEDRGRGRIASEEMGDANLLRSKMADDLKNLKQTEAERMDALNRERLRTTRKNTMGILCGKLTAEEEAVRRLVESSEASDWAATVMKCRLEAPVPEPAHADENNSTITRRAQATLEKLHRSQDQGTGAASFESPENPSVAVAKIETKTIPDVDPVTGSESGTRKISCRTDPRLFYQEQCMLTGAKVNGSFLGTLPKDPDLVTKIDIAHNYIGKKGIRAVLDVLSICRKVTHLDLADNKLENGAVMWMVAAVRGHEALTSINLDTNLIAKSGGAALVTLLTQQPTITHLSINSNPLLMSPMVRRIQQQAEANRINAERGVVPAA